MRSHLKNYPGFFHLYRNDEFYSTFIFYRFIRWNMRWTLLLHCKFQQKKLFSMSLVFYSRCIMKCVNKRYFLWKKNVNLFCDSKQQRKYMKLKALNGWARCARLHVTKWSSFIARHTFCGHNNSKINGDVILLRIFAAIQLALHLSLYFVECYALIVYINANLLGSHH